MKKAIKLELTADERRLLKEKKISLKELLNWATDEVIALLQPLPERAREISALVEFQSIPSLGIGFARELMEQGYYSLEQLRGKDAVTLFDAYEQHCGVWADPCVEDSYRLLVDYIEHKDSSKRWWDFTAERKAYREKYGFPADKPKKA